MRTVVQAARRAARERAERRDARVRYALARLGLTRTEFLDAPEAELTESLSRLTGWSGRRTQWLLRERRRLRIQISPDQW